MANPALDMGPLQASVQHLNNIVHRRVAMLLGGALC
jgi:hypothetical protein